MCLKTRTRLYFQEITFGISRIILFQNLASALYESLKTKIKQNKKQKKKQKQKKNNAILKMLLVVPNQLIIVNTTTSAIMSGHLGESG